MPSLLEAIERKYCTNSQFDDDVGIGAGVDCHATTGATEKRLISIFIPRLSPLLTVPELLVLNDCDIDCAGDFDGIKDKCQRVRELDLAQNKLQDWQEVFHILRNMPRIEFLNLSQNRLIGPIPSLHAPSISSLRNVVLNGTYLSWSYVDVLLENLPILEELHLSLNNYDKVLIDTAVSEHDIEENVQSCEQTVNENENENNCHYKQQHHQQSQSTNSNLAKCKQVSAHKSLKTLHFTGNPVESWHEICRLGRVFPNLENFVLADCPIRSLNICCDKRNSDESNDDNCSSSSNSNCCELHIDNFSSTSTNSNSNSNSNTSCFLTTSAKSSASEPSLDNETPYKYFPNLVLLNLSCANISAWDDIEQLAQFPKLQNLRVKKWPLWERLECTEHERRQLLIAQLPNVRLLNGGGVISADEREDAERAFIRYYMNKPDWERTKRYDELIAKHGKLDPLVNINLKPDKHVKVFLTYKEQTQPRLVNIYRSVADLKVKLEKIIQLPANKMRLFYLDQDYKEFGPEEMRIPNKLLYSYNIQNGDEIIIDEKKQNILQK